MIDHDLYLPRTRDDNDAALAAVERAGSDYPDLDRTSTLMDLLTVHNTVGLDFERMLAADDLNFYHDVFGIARHLNRETGRLEDQFFPRFARKE